MVQCVTETLSKLGDGGGRKCTCVIVHSCERTGNDGKPPLLAVPEGSHILMCVRRRQEGMKRGGEKKRGRERGEEIKVSVGV